MVCCFESSLIFLICYIIEFVYDVQCVSVFDNKIGLSLTEKQHQKLPTFSRRPWPISAQMS